MSCLAIIPARGGSRRIPGKNLRDFCGKPIIAYSIEAAIASQLFDEVMVSTDDEEIGRVGMNYGAAFPFVRSDLNSGDFATTADVITEVIDKYVKLGQGFEYICCIYPTAVFITPERLTKAFNQLCQRSVDSVLPVVKFEYPVQRGLLINNNGNLEYAWPENRYSRSQDLEVVYHDAGQYYWLRTKAFLNEKDLILENNHPLVLPETEVQDIDTETDWTIAEIKYVLWNKALL